MQLVRTNTIDKFGVKKRIITADTPILNILLLDLKYVDSKFFVVDDNNTYIGSITHDQLKRYGDSFTHDTRAGDICNIVKDHLFCELDDLNSEQAKDSIIEIFSLKPDVMELPIVNREKKLMAIIDRKILVAFFHSFKFEQDKPINIWGHKKQLSSSLGSLNNFANNVNSQHGEDGIIARIFKKIGMQSKFAVEFGGWDGVYLSNIRNLITEYGFSAIYIEGDAEKAKDCRNNYKDFENVKCVEGFVGFEENKKLDEYLSENGAPEKFDLLSIDVDGYDYHVWDSLVLHTPRVVIIEFNPSIANDILFISPYSEKYRQGSSASAMVNLGLKKGYELVAVTQTNCIFVHMDDFNKLEIDDNSLYALKQETPLSDNKFFQTYDKTIYYQGYARFIWSDEKFISDKFQMINIQSKI